MIIFNATHDQPDEQVKDWLLHKYFTDLRVRAVADQIHHSRMMAPPACLDCIQRAINRLQAREKLGHL